MALPTVKELQKLTKELILFLQKNELFSNVSIYVQGTRISSDKHDSAIETVHTTDYGSYYVTEDIDVTTIVEYSNPDTITMTFEGPLYHALNYGNGKMEEKLQKLFNKYGLYFEQGYAWSLAAYEN